MRRIDLSWATVLVLCLTSHVAAQDVPTFVTAPQPLLNLGDAGDVLTGVSDALRHSNGNIVVAHCSNLELRVYDAAGVHVRSAAAAGTGFSNVDLLKRIFPAGSDSVGAYLLSGLTGTVGVHAADGTLARSFRVPRSAEVIGRMADGSFIAIQPETYRRPRPVRPAGAQRLTTTLYRYSATGEVLDSATGVPGIEVIVPEAGATGSAGITRVVRLGRTTVAAVLPDGVVVGAQQHGSFDIYGVDLQRRAQVTTMSQPEPVRDAHRRAWEDAYPTLMFPPGGGVLPVFGSVYADTLPAYRHVVAGRDGRVWVQDPERPAIYPLVWTVYDGGRPVARAEMPVRFFPLEFGGDWVLGVSFNDVGDERVQLLRLIPGPLSGRALPPRDAQPPDRPRCGPWSSR